MRLCTGPSHPDPVWLPLDREHWHFHLSGRRKGKSYNHCKSCRRLYGMDGNHGLVEVAELLPALTELISRCDGVLGVQATHGIAHSTVYGLLSGDHPRITKRTARRILSALIEQRKHDRVNGASSKGFRRARWAHAHAEGKLEQRYGI